MPVAKEVYFFVFLPRTSNIGAVVGGIPCPQARPMPTPCSIPYIGRVMGAVPCPQAWPKPTPSPIPKIEGMVGGVPCSVSRGLVQAYTFLHPQFRGVLGCVPCPQACPKPTSGQASVIFWPSSSVLARVLRLVGWPTV